jgi:hypothetical protein
MHATAYHTIGAVADLLTMPRWRLAYLVERGDLPGPSLQVPGRRLFTDEDVEKIRAALATRTPRPRGRRPGTR